MCYIVLSEIRVDKVFIPKVKKTKEGYIKGIATVTRTGVFKYMNADGTMRLELRHPDDVLNVDSLETLKSIPITNEHPSSLVTSTNADILSVGMTGETVTVNGGEISTSITITHKDGIEAINRGKQELSLGYRLDVIPEIGEYNGEKYTHRQTNIDYNHLAIVTEGRAGRSARLNLDGALYQQLDEALYQCDATTEENKTMSNEKVEKLDAVDTVAVIAPVVSVSNREDRLDAIIDQLKDENAKLKAINIDSLVSEGVKVRLALLKRAETLTNTDSLVDKSDREIMELAIKSKVTNIDLKDKSDAYVEGRFDALVDSYVNTDAIQSQLVNLVNTDVKPVNVSALDILKSHSTNKGV